jgi:TolB-like protein
VDVPPDETQRQLQRILASEQFAGAARLSRFLRYIVEQACQGDSARLKEFAIGTEVFDRDQRFDPRLDSVVRVEAGRLRAKLVEYYARAGADDPIVIDVPRGGYVPVFERRQTARRDSKVDPESVPPVTAGAVSAAAAVASPAAQPSVATGAPAWQRRAALAAAAVLALAGLLLLNGDRAPARPLHEVRVAVLPLRTYTNHDEALALLAAQLTDGVTRELARLGTLQVVSHLSALHVAAEQQTLPAMAQALRADVFVAASLGREGERLRVQAVLIDAVADRKFWVGDVDGSIGALPELQRRVAAAAEQAVAANSGGSYWTRGR